MGCWCWKNAAVEEAAPPPRTSARRSRYGVRPNACVKDRKSRGEPPRPPAVDNIRRISRIALFARSHHCIVLASTDLDRRIFHAPSPTVTATNTISIPLLAGVVQPRLGIGVAVLAEPLPLIGTNIKAMRGAARLKKRMWEKRKTPPHKKTN